MKILRPNKFQQAFLDMVDAHLEFLANNAASLQSAGVQETEWKILRVQAHRRAGHTIGSAFLAENTSLPVLFVSFTTALQQALEATLVAQISKSEWPRLKLLNISSGRGDPSLFFGRKDPQRWKFVIADNIVLLNTVDQRLRREYFDFRHYILPKTDLLIELQ